MGAGVRLPSHHGTTLLLVTGRCAMHASLRRLYVPSIASSQRQASTAPGAQPSSKRVLPTAPVYPAPSPKAFISDSTHPHFNLSLEHFLLRTRPANEPVLLLYRNAPCIVIGRNQNPWHELDVERMRALGIKLVRRRSGGGAVYHDLGNSNYSFHIAREDFTRRSHAELVARSLNSNPVALTSANVSDRGDGEKGAYVNGRNDICVALRSPPSDGTAAFDPPKNGERKISGSAYKITSHRAYHHGTMLLSSNLAHLGSALKPSRAMMTSKGVASVSSPVINLADAFASRAEHLDHDSFCQSVIEEYRRTHAKSSGHPIDVVRISEETYKDVLPDTGDELHAGWREMDSWEWTWGQTPEFTHSICSRDGHGSSSHDVSESLPSLSLDLRVKSGVIETAIHGGAEELDHGTATFLRRLVGARYDILANAPDTLSERREAFDAAQPEQGTRLALEHLGYSPRDKGQELQIVRHLLSWLKRVL